MPPPNLSLLSLLLLLLLTLLSTSTSSPTLSTIAISDTGNQTVVCALFASRNNQPYSLNCTAYPGLTHHSYTSGAILYSAIAAGNDFLCALGAPASSNLSSMLWWDFNRPPSPPQDDGGYGGPPIDDDDDDHVRRVYHGPPLAGLSSSDTHVCALHGSAAAAECWRWPQLGLPAQLNFTMLAVGGDFVCGLLDSGAIRCFGNDTEVVGNVPRRNFNIVAAGTRHACGISVDGELACWGAGAHQFNGSDTSRLIDINSLSLGENQTCARRGNGTVICWGDGDVGPPADIAGAQFITIEARGSTFCGILMANFSLVCWGSQMFQQKHVVFDRVLPGSCTAISSCACGVLAGSANSCLDGHGICQTCKVQYTSPSPPIAPARPPPTNSITTAGGKSGNSGSGGKSRWRRIIIIVGSVGAGVALLAATSFFVFWYGTKGRRVHDTGRLTVAAPTTVEAEEQLEQRLSAFMGKGGPSSTVEEFSLELLLDATDGFSEECKVGSGSFGTVYRATLDGNRAVAIKRAEPPPAVASTSGGAAAAEGRRRDRESAFVSELALLSRVNHKNLVRLLGYCHQRGEQVLVYEFMENGTLHDHLHRPAAPPTAPPLGSWEARIRVALDAARGIEYLHVYAVPPIIHRDVKSSNILLDEAWAAKVSDFGLSLMSPDAGNGRKEEGGWSGGHVSLRAAGTVGYMDPEYYRLQQLTAKSDVYSFGVVLLELLTGCRAVHRHGESGSPRNVVEFAVPHIEADEVHRVLDRRLPAPTSCEVEAVAAMAYIAADCVCPNGRDRPSMTDIVGGLERALAACGGGGGRRLLSRSFTTRSV